MRRTLNTIFIVLVVASLTTSSVFAAGFHLSAGFHLGSLIAEGFASGLGRTDVMVFLDATGDPVVLCASPGGNLAPGQNPPKVSAHGNQFLDGTDPLRKNGRSPFSVETGDTELSGREGGCPNNKWTADVVFVFWTDATLTLTDLDGNVLVEQNYTCVTTRDPDTVSCTPI